MITISYTMAQDSNPSRQQAIRNESEEWQACKERLQNYMDEVWNDVCDGRFTTINRDCIADYYRTSFLLEEIRFRDIVAPLLSITGKDFPNEVGSQVKHVFAILARSCLEVLDAGHDTTRDDEFGGVPLWKTFVHAVDEDIFLQHFKYHNNELWQIWDALLSRDYFRHIQTLEVTTFFVTDVLDLLIRSQALSNFRSLRNIIVHDDASKFLHSRPTESERLNAGETSGEGSTPNRREELRSFRFTNERWKLLSELTYRNTPHEGQNSGVEMLSLKGFILSSHSLPKLTSTLEKVWPGGLGQSDGYSQIFLSAMKAARSSPPQSLYGLWVPHSGYIHRNKSGDGDDLEVVLLEHLHIDLTTGVSAKFVIYSLKHLQELTMSAFFRGDEIFKDGDFRHLRLLRLKFYGYIAKLDRTYAAELDRTYTAEQVATWMESGSASALEMVEMVEIVEMKMYLQGSEIHHGRFARTLGSANLPPSLQKFVTFSDWDKLSEDAKKDYKDAYKINVRLRATLFADSRDEPPEVKRLREFNQSLYILQGKKETATFGKVFICGDAGMGKTTLRRALVRNNCGWMSSCFGVNDDEPATKGIEINHLSIYKNCFARYSGVQEFDLAFWDLAGQHEYEVLHSAFLPDLALADGQATFFLVVCSAQLDGRDQGTRERHSLPSKDRLAAAETSLTYWLRFIASNSFATVGESRDSRRKVFVVLNCVGSQQTGHDRAHWTMFLRRCTNIFSNVLDLHVEPFIVNAKTGPVFSLKQHLEHTARQIMQNSKQPCISAHILQSCQTYVQNLADGENNKYQRVGWRTFLGDILRSEPDRTADVYPVVTWNTFLSEVLKNDPAWPLDVIEAATIYLHECGHLVFFRNPNISANHIMKVDSLQEALVVLDPEWLCKQVIGHLLLPGRRANDEGVIMPETYVRTSSSKLPAVIPQDILLDSIPKNKREEMTQILIRLGLGYSVLNEGKKGLYVPALMKMDNSGVYLSTPSARSSQDKGCSWVMGFALAPKDSTTNLLPVSVFRHLQVQLALDKNIGRKSGSNYLATDLHISFKWKEMEVLVEFNRDPAHGDHNRLDILVKTLVSLATVNHRSERQQQVDVAYEVVTRARKLASQFCSNVEMDTFIIKPWDACDKQHFYEREKDSVEKILCECKEEIARSGMLRPTNYNIGAEVARYEDLLAEEDWNRVVADFENRLKQSELALRKLGIVDSKQAVEEVSGWDNVPKADSARHVDREIVSDSVETLLRVMIKMVEERFDCLEKSIHHLDKKFEGYFLKILEFQNTLYKRVQSLENFTIQDKDTMVPRFPYITSDSVSKADSIWMRITDACKDALGKEFFLHFMCESRYNDSKVHVVVGKEGISQRQAKDWVQKITPLLKWSFKFASWATKFSGQVIIPGLNLLLSESALDEVNEVGNVDSLINHILTSCDTSTGKSLDILGASQEKGEALQQDARVKLNEYITKMGYDKFKQKTGLQRVIIRDGAHVEQMCWICESCFTKYGRKAVQVEF